ncbi:two-component regulator propeller domain-containing protein [Spirosoma soli]|uniref:histidine kinase n=1 Tax=Spirosoma soli TaxID=1770529 RepID=A0ABW5M7J4_9BACT
MKYKIVSLFFIFWGWTLAVLAQALPYSFFRLTTEQGLSNNQVNSITRDSRGFLWIGTMSGLNRYDGYSFRVFRHSLRDSASIPNNYINRLFEDPLGRMWVKTRVGDAVYDPVTEHFHRNVRPFLQAVGLPITTTFNSARKDRQGNYWLLTSNGLYYYRTTTKQIEAVHHRPKVTSTPADNDLTALQEDSRGVIWLVHRSGLLEKLDSRTHRVTYRSEALRQENKRELHEYKLIIDADNDLWLHVNDTDKGVFFINTKTNQLTHFQQNARQTPLNSNLVRDITQDEQGMIWIGTDHGGINLIDKKTFAVRYLLHDPTDETSLSQNSIYDFYRDSEGVIWVGTYKQGISYYHKNSVRFPLYRHRASDPGSLNYDDVNRFVEDAKGNLWVGTNGGGLSYFDRSTNRFTPSAAFSKVAGPKSVIVSLLIDHEQTLWVGTYYGGLYAIKGNQVTTYKHDPANPASIASNNIWEIFEDQRHDLWIGTLDGGLDRFDRRQNRFYHHRFADRTSVYSDYISSIMQDRAGNLWFGTANGIDVRDSRSGRFRHYANYNNDPKGLSNNNITSLLEDSRGIIWVGTNEGLNFFDKATGTFFALRQEDGLPDNTILSLIEDANQALWIGTPNGLSQLSVRQNQAGQKTFVFKNYDEADGLPGRAFNESAAFKTSRGELVFGGPNGFTIFRPETFRTQARRPPVVLTDLQIFNNSVRPGQEVDGSVPLTQSITESPAITLTHRQNVFSIEFAALNFVHLEKNKYQYKLEGFNDDWLTADNRDRKATFTNLNPGDYVFRVRVSNNNSGWNEDSIRLPITILPPFWKSAWAYVLYALFIIGVLLLARWILLERARLNFQLEQDRRHAQQMHELDEMKLRFFTNVSHEFRTPLTLVISPLEQLIKKDDVPAGQQRQLQLIYRNAKRLLNLVNQLLDFRKMEVQGLTLRPTRQDIVAFCREIFYSFSDLSEKKQIHFTFDSNVAELETVFDQEKLERILFNLLSNAFKFTPEHGKVAITLHLPAVAAQPAESSENQWLTIQVTDTGIGITPAQQDKIFERFFQSDLPDTLINQGSGIGLAITKEFVQLHGGTLSVESEPDRGSTFTIRLPVRTESELAALYQPVRETVEPTEPFVVAEAPPVKSAGKKPVILLVEDNEDFRFYLKDNLSRQYTLLEAANGKEGWQLVQSHLPDLVVSDVMMPEMDGITLCRRIKADRRTAYIPVLLLTARSAEEQKLEGFATGASDYITKPFNVEILHARIRNLIAQQNLLLKALQPSMNISPGEVEVTSLDEKLIQKALSIVEKNMANPDFSVEELSRELGMSRVHLYKKLLALTDKSPIEFIRTIRVRRAAQLLGKSQLTVAEIAYQVGFNNPKNFTKYFKQEFGVIPSQYATEKQKETTE